MKKIIFLMTFFIFAVNANSANVLFIGDSHSVGPFGWKMDELIRRTPNIQVGSYASCGSVFQWWETGKQTPCGYFFRDMKGSTEKGDKGATPIFDNLMKEINPQLVVVELGANYAGYQSDEAAVKDMKKLVKKIQDANAKCFWVSKPDARKGNDTIPRILRLTREAVLPYCSFFDSTKVTAYPEEGGDGVHYWGEKGRPVAEKWAEKAYESLKPYLDQITEKVQSADEKNDSSVSGISK